MDVTTAIALKVLSPHQQRQHRLLEMHILRLSPGGRYWIRNSASSNTCFSKSFKWFWWTWMFKNHCCTAWYSEQNLHLFSHNLQRHILHGPLISRRLHLCHLHLAYFIFFLFLNIPSNYHRRAFIFTISSAYNVSHMASCSHNYSNPSKITSQKPDHNEVFPLNPNTLIISYFLYFCVII